MKLLKAGSEWPHWVRRAGWLFSAAMGLSALVIWMSYKSDRGHLRAVAQQLTDGLPDDTSKIIKLTYWVHDNGPARENENYFVFRHLRATPLQVLRGGGDCADKSRLLSSMLAEIQIPSTMVLCFSRESGIPTHTVVEARTGLGNFIIVDPAYRLYFPKPQAGYYNLLELRTDPKILDRRLDELIPLLPPTAPVYCYKPSLAAYDQAASINWEKNAVTRAVGSILGRWFGEELYRIRRPIVLEEPQLFLAAVLLVAGTFGVLASRIAARILATMTGLQRKEVALCGR